MVYIFNKYISPKKTIKMALTDIYGVGIKRALKIANELCLNPNLRFSSLKPLDVSKICKYIANNFKVASFLHKEIQENIKKHIKIRNYKGFRHKSNLPVRGQRTHTNAQTRKNLRFIVRNT